MRLTFVFTTFVLFVPAALMAQERTDVFADPQNLKVLPSDISSADLGNTMKGFAMGLGVRCNDCHVGEPDAPLHTYDFASDEKQMKQKARVMLEMIAEINTNQLARLDDVEPAPRVEVRCVTCHRGQAKPKLIQDVLDEQLAEHGVDAAVAHYKKLREDFHGSHSYDFSEFTLPMYAQGLAESGQVAEAAVLAKLNTENFPDSYYSFFVLAEASAANGDTEAARKSYERAMEISPRAKGFIESRLAALPED